MNYHDQLYQCSKCKKEDHEGYHCRCESRNIEISKELRKKGLSPWQDKHRERLRQAIS